MTDRSDIAEPRELPDDPEYPEAVLRALSSRPGKLRRLVWRLQSLKPVSPHLGGYKWHDLRLERVLLFGPAVLWALLYGAAAEDAGRRLPLDAMLWPTGLLLVAALYRLPQELIRGQRRSWDEDVERNVLSWHDPSGEWQYSSWQASRPAVWLRVAVAALMPVYCSFLFWFDDALTVALLLPVATAGVVYLYRHLPTPFVPARRFRECHTCGKWHPGDTVPRCDRCGRITEAWDVAAKPGLRRRWRDL